MQVTVGDVVSTTVTAESHEPLFSESSVAVQALAVVPNEKGQAQGKAWLALKTRVGEWYWTIVKSSDIKDFVRKPGHAHGADPQGRTVPHEGIRLRSHYCPCATCGHTWMGECNEYDCPCCREVCT